MRFDPRWFGTELITFDEFMKKLTHFAFRRCERSAAERGGPVHPAKRLAVSLLGRPQVSFLFEPLEKRIQAPRTDAVSVARQLLDDPQAEDGTFHGVVKHVETDQARVQIAVGHFAFLI